MDNCLIEYEQEELDLSQRGIISDQINEHMSAARKFRFGKDDAGEGTSSKYEEESQNILDNKWREEKDVGTERKNKKKKFPQKKW